MRVNLWRKCSLRNKFFIDNTNLVAKYNPFIGVFFLDIFADKKVSFLTRVNYIYHLRIVPILVDWHPPFSLAY